MDVVVYSHRDAHWILPAFSYMFNIFWSSTQPVLIAGGEPDVELPPNFQWLPVESRVKERWSDGLIEFLNMLKSDVVCLFLEDYLLIRYVAWDLIGSLEQYMIEHPNVLKIDLTADRLHSGHAVDVEAYGRADIIETDWQTSYNYSLQLALWNRKHLLSCLRPEMSPWDFELQDKPREDLRVLGTRNFPCRYLNAAGMSLDAKYRYRTEHIRDGLGGRTIERIPPEHIGRMLELGILPPQEK